MSFLPYSTAIPAMNVRPWFSACISSGLDNIHQADIIRRLSYSSFSGRGSDDLISGRNDPFEFGIIEVFRVKTYTISPNKKVTTTSSIPPACIRSRSAKSCFDPGH
ncbi:14575_t:CDS:2 [Funneliformis geosporum]|uniref:14575_t:CDS:1 n=1 Tax=Funneliformis geosporum TaxID=1117311 RepID=A0A9W4SQ72_9GLOM|nr:14575_t:CDS:2 [Funneliformis geosporum]